MKKVFDSKDIDDKPIKDYHRLAEVPTTKYLSI